MAGQFNAIGKWCLKNWVSATEGCYWYTLDSNYNSIVYVNCPDRRKMKLQVDNYKIENIIKSQTQLCGPSNYWIDSIHIRWAADSMGNGIFKETPVKAIKQGILTEATTSAFTINVGNWNVEFKLPAKNSGIESLRIYSLSGSRMAQWRNPGKQILWKTQGIPAGVYLANIVYENKNIGSYKFVIKK